ncbi:2OG-Fe(II) oxygenase [Kordiimonas lipolytica]|uniref:2OG-Fe(II) oxygenase n=1 Tax=Kordiimonas lipolytica TaxID=1662421 RepID=A0ABV8UDY4_9PROT
MLAFIGDSSDPKGRAFSNALTEANLPKNENELVLFAVSREEQDLHSDSLKPLFKRGRVFHDPDMEIAKSYGTTQETEEGLAFTGAWYLLDPTLRVYGRGALEEVDRLIGMIRSLPRANDHAATNQEPWAPVLLVPRVLTPKFCRHLIDLYRQGNPNQSGFMREIEGRTVPVMDSSFKRRSDAHITDAKTRNTINRAIALRLKPEIQKAFQFNATRIERYIVSRYAEEDKGFFKRHRDNTTSGTAHRRFAVSINLNAEDYEGGELMFPEFGTRTYKPPTGGAVVFSCSLLHEATPVTKGERFATLPFLYDDAAAEIRDQNRDKIESETLVVG